MAGRPTRQDVKRWADEVTAVDERAYFFARGPAETPPIVLIRVAGARWRVEECLELAKGDCGLDEYEVRSWVGWHRHVTLSLLALAVAVIRSRVPRPGRKKRGERLIRVSVPEVRKWLLRLVWSFVAPAERVLAWSVWRRRHQHRARECHYKKRGVRPPD